MGKLRVWLRWSRRCLTNIYIYIDGAWQSVTLRGLSLQGKLLKQPKHTTTNKQQKKLRNDKIQSFNSKSMTVSRSSRLLYTYLYVYTFTVSSRVLGLVTCNAIHGLDFCRWSVPEGSSLHHKRETWYFVTEHQTDVGLGCLNWILKYSTFSRSLNQKMYGSWKAIPKYFKRPPCHCKWNGTEVHPLSGLWGCPSTNPATCLISGGARWLRLYAVSGERSHQALVHALTQWPSLKRV